MVHVSDVLAVLDVLDRIQPGVFLQRYTCDFLPPHGPPGRPSQFSARPSPVALKAANLLAWSGLDHRARDKVQHCNREIEVVR